MFHLSHYLRCVRLLGLTLAISSVWAGEANAAGIVGYRNDTNQVIVVQTVMVVNNMTRRSKPQTLFPGEVALDGLIGTGTRRITIYDPKKPNTPLFQGDITNNDDAVFSIQPETTVMVKSQPPTTPKVKLVPIPLPSGSAKVMRPGQSAPPSSSKPSPSTTPPPTTTPPKKP